MIERYLEVGFNGISDNRIWFTPDEMNLKRFIDPETGSATVIFDTATVRLNTESELLGVTEDPVLRDFVDHFNTHYDAFAQFDFPVQDPTDETGQTIIMVPIFERLREAMQAVSLARFFRDNDLPLDTWWINSWDAPDAYIPATIPTLTNSSTLGNVTVTLSGGVQVDLPNAYIPDATAEDIANLAASSRPHGTGDLGGQTWTINGTSMGDLTAVAASADADEQDGNVRLGASDLSFVSPGEGSLSFDRFYDSAFLQDGELGKGWQIHQFDLQFERPSWHDDLGFMTTPTGEPVETVGDRSRPKDTRLRSGEIRLINRQSGQLLNFRSTLELEYAVDNQGNPFVVLAGLNAENVPDFTPGDRQNGTTLVQDATTKDYILTLTDGSSARFDSSGSLLTVTSRLQKTITYNYTNELLTEINDTAGQQITIEYDADDRVQFVSGPEATLLASRRVEYVYTAGGLLDEVRTQTHNGGGVYSTVRTVSYTYNADKQLTSYVGPDGLTQLDTTPDLRGRSSMRKDVNGNMADFQFEVDTATGNRMTMVTDMGDGGSVSETDHGVLALQYFATGASSMREFDGEDRLMKTMDPLGNVTELAYDSGSNYVNQVTLPTPGRAAIDIERNNFGLPTTITDPANTNGTPIEIEYNAANLPTRTVDPEGRVTTTTYTTDFNVETVTRGFGTPLASTTTFFYDANGLLERIQNSLSETVVTYEYDTLGRVTRVIDGTGIETTYEYDVLSRLTKVFDPRLTGVTDFVQYDYNANDQVTLITTPTGTIQYEYDLVVNTGAKHSCR